jgi:hypothetical protein
VRGIHAEAGKGSGTSWNKLAFGALSRGDCSQLKCKNSDLVRAWSLAALAGSFQVGFLM